MDKFSIIPIIMILGGVAVGLATKNLEVATMWFVGSCIVSALQNRDD